MTTLWGCGGPAADYSKVDLVSASGKVTLDGQPLPDATVIFKDPADETYSYGLTDASGNFKLQFDSEMAGVKAGKKVVSISTARTVPGLNNSPGEEGGDPDAKPKRSEKVPERYNKKTELTADVSHSNKVFNFDLKSK